MGSLHMWLPGCSESAGFPASSLLSIRATMTHAVLVGIGFRKGRTVGGQPVHVLLSAQLVPRCRGWTGSSW